jgi:MFS transporter, FHS family, L-fucose permease
VQIWRAHVAGASIKKIWENNMTTNRPALFTLMNVWFFWGFVAASNGILIPLFKEKFHLSQGQSQLVDSAFYAAYFIGSILYFVISGAVKTDFLNKIGYKNGIVYGLILSAVGSLVFIPAANTQSFALLLTALFVVGLGFALQQIATNPYMIALGDPATGALRINMGGAVNNFGTTIGPVLVSYAIFGSFAEGAAQSATVESVKTPYLILGALFLVFAAWFWVAKLPKVSNDEPVEIGLGALRYPQVVLGMVAIFVYVGVEVTIGSNLGEYLAKTRQLDSSQISMYISLFWGSLMMGRWTASLPGFGVSGTLRRVLTVVVPFVAFGVVLGVNALHGSDVSILYPYAICIFGLVAAFFLSGDKPVRTMLIFTGMGGLAMIVGLLTDGQVALFAFISGGMACSVLWPCIFSLGTAGLGKYTSQASAFLIMMILGGAIIPPAQGYLADFIGIKPSYIVAVLCFGYLFFFAMRVQGVLRRQGIDFDQDMVATGKGH